VARDDATGRIRYTYREANGAETNLPAEQVMHLRGLSTDGIMGMSVIQAAAEAIGLSLRTEEHGARLFSNGAQPGVILKHPLQLSAEGAKKLKASFDEKHSGAGNAHATILLEEGMSVEKIGMTSEESQFLEGRKFQRSEIAMFFGVPPHMIGDVERGTSWGSGIEQQSLGFVTYTLLPWLTNLEEAFARDLIPEADQGRFSYKFSTDALTRADFRTRQEGRKIQFEAGVISPNEWRRSEGLNPRDGGDVFRAAPIQQTRPANAA
jgi:HK97 family phage portal protein